MPTLRVALAVGSLDLGGAEKQVVGIARELKAMGVDVEVILTATRGPLQKVLDDASVPSFCPAYRPRESLRRGGFWELWLMITQAYRMVRIAIHLRRRRFHVIHAFLFHCYVMTVPMARIVGIPVRVAARRGTTASVRQHRILEKIVPLANRLSTVVVGNSQAVVDHVAAVERIPKNKLRVIPNAVDLPDVTANPAKQPPLGMMIANLIHYKGHLDLVKALSEMDSPPAIRCIGEGPMRSEIEAAIHEARLHDKVSLEGTVYSARDQYRDAQFALLASHTEGMPNAVLEAMAAGLPVIATDVGGCSELVEDGVTGLLVPPRDPSALATAIQHMVSDVDFRVSAGELARRRAAAFSWDSAARAHVQLYTELLARHGTVVRVLGLTDPTNPHV